MSRTTGKLLHVIGKPSSTESKRFGKNVGIANLLMHFSFDEARVAAYQQELTEAGWISPNTPEEEFKENIAETSMNLKMPVSD